MGNSSPSMSSFEYESEEVGKLPKRFVVLKQLGKGGYGSVVKCLDLKAKKIVAVKTPIRKDHLEKEATMLKLLMDNNLDQKNIIKFYEESSTKDYLVFEVLDKTLIEYLYKRKTPMYLREVRDVIEQLAVAFDALKEIGVIHTDVKTNNIMLVDQARQPLKVKLIDFGLAVLKPDAKNHKIHQALAFRAPEVILGLPYSEAIDIWSLGCVIAMLVFGCLLFPGRNDYELLKYMIDIMGLPPDHVIDAGKKSTKYFTKTDTNQWRFKTPKEYFGSHHSESDNRCYKFYCLDQLKQIRLEEDNIAEADERRECIELLKAMLRWDEKERITPREILAHPFITGQYPSSSSHLSSCDEGSSMNQAAELGTKKIPETSIKQDDPGTQETPENSIRQEAEPSTSTNKTQGLNAGIKTVQPAAAVMVRLPSVQIMVQQAPLENRIKLEETSDKESVRENNTLAPITAATACSSTAAPALTLENISNPDNTEDHKEDNTENDTEDHIEDDAGIDMEDPTEDHTEDGTEDSERKKKRKNRIGRFVAWWRKTFFSCRSMDNIEE